MRSRNIKISAPMHPQVIQGVSSPIPSSNLDVNVDGEDIEGVLSFAVKAGPNGYTHVILEVPSSVLMQLSAAFFVKSTANDTWGTQTISSLMSQVLCDTIPDDEELTSHLCQDRDLCYQIGTKFMEEIINTLENTTT